MIKFVGIKKSFEEKVILNKIDGAFQKGKVNIIVGASGTGKSVLLKCLVGLIEPDQGQVYFDKKEITRSSPETKKEIRQEMGMLFQGGALFDSLNVEENVMFPLAFLTNNNKDEQRERANYCLNRVGLANAGNKKISDISGGMQKRVGIARALVTQPKYLFCDEPNSGLDPSTALKVDELIQDITQEYNTTTVVVSHDINSMMTIGEHIMFLHKGEITWEGSYKDIFKSKSKSFNEFFFSNKMAKIIKEKK